MDVTVYSVISSVVLYNLSLIIVFLLRRSNVIRARHAATVLMFLTLFGALRLLSPFDMNEAYVLRSYTLLPALKKALAYPLFGKLRVSWLLLSVWGVGTVAMIVRDVRKYRRAKQYLKNMDFVERENVQEIATEFGERFGVLVSPDVSEPYVTGIRRPTIYVPDLDLSDDEWRMVLRHETQHIRSWDEVKKLFFLAVEALFWWNPLAHISGKEISTLIELCCDEKVTRKMDDKEQLRYMETLKTVAKLTAPRPVPAGGATLIGGETEMRLRFDALMSRETRRSKVLYRLLPALLAVVYLLSYMVIVQPAYRAPTEEITTFQDVYAAYDITQNLSEAENEYIVFVNNEYQLYINGEYICRLTEEILSDPQYNTIPIIGGD